MSKVQAAILDDYQNVARSLLASREVPDNLEFTVFHDHLDHEGALAERLRGFEVVCVMRERTPFRRSLLERLPDLRLLVTSGMRNASIDMAAARQRGVTVCGTPSVGAPTAELTWGLIIGLLRRIPREDRATRGRGWQETMGVGLQGKTLGVAGLGKLGARVARVGLAFDMEVVAWSRNLTEERCREVGVTLVSREELLSRSDVLTIHLVLSDRTRGLLGAPELAMMKPAAVLINTSRGPIVQEAALVDALQRGVIAGAGLDVFDTEPLPPDHPLRRCDNTVVTPHLGYVEGANYGAYFDGYLAAVRGYLDGSPVNVVNSRAGTEAKQ